MIQPLFYNGFPVTPGYAHHRNVELPAVKGGKLLQGMETIFDQDKIGIRIITGVQVLINNKIPYAEQIEIRNKRVSVAAWPV